MSKLDKILEAINTQDKKVRITCVGATGSYPGELCRLFFDPSTKIYSIVVFVDTDWLIDYEWDPTRERFTKNKYSESAPYLRFDGIDV